MESARIVLLSAQSVIVLTPALVARGVGYAIVVAGLFIAAATFIYAPKGSGDARVMAAVMGGFTLLAAALWFAFAVRRIEWVADARSRTLTRSVQSLWTSRTSWLLDTISEVGIVEATGGDGPDEFVVKAHIAGIPAPAVIGAFTDKADAVRVQTALRKMLAGGSSRSATLP